MSGGGDEPYSVPALTEAVRDVTLQLAKLDDHIFDLNDRLKAIETTLADLRARLERLERGR